VFVSVYLPAIELEEQHLRDLFPDYATYAARIHRFVPSAKWQGKEAQFSSALYFRNEEYKAAVGFLLALAWLVSKRWILHML
jgi:hypothetical protein